MPEVKKEQSADKVNGVDHRLLDGYDGGSAPPEAFIQGLLKSAPPEVQQRAKEWAVDREKLGGEEKRG